MGSTGKSPIPRPSTSYTDPQSGNMSSENGVLRCAMISHGLGIMPTLISSDRCAWHPVFKDEDIPNQAVVFIAFNNHAWRQDLSTAAPKLMYGPLGRLVPRIIVCSMTSVFPYQPRFDLSEPASALVLLLKFPGSYHFTAGPSYVQSLTLMHANDSTRSNYYVLGGEGSKDIEFTRIFEVFEEARAGISPESIGAILIDQLNEDAKTKFLMVMGFCDMCTDWWLETLASVESRLYTDQANSVFRTVDWDVHVMQLVVYLAALSANYDTVGIVLQQLQPTHHREAAIIVDSLSRGVFERLLSLCEAARSLLELARHHSQSKRPESAYSDLLKMQYLSQNYTKAAAIFAIVFLPGIFVSTFFALPFFEGLGGRGSLWIWFVLAIPITLLSLSLLSLWFKLPTFRLRMKQRDWRMEGREV